MGGPSYDVDAQKNLTKKAGDDAAAANDGTKTVVTPDNATNDDATQTDGAPVPKPTDKGSVASV